ncbi:MAG: ThiF family adenylyltransferase [Acidimicrobiia bacterium]
MAFSFDEAFSRNLGLLTPAEQLTVRSKRVAICGLGGVGGYHLLALARLGFTKFSVVEFDRFEYVNFNRQVGATVDTVGASKLQTTVGMARAINPDIDVRTFETRLAPDLFDEFFADADLFLDGIDFFESGLREKVFNYCYTKQIPVVSAGPIGVSVGWMVMMPNGPSPEEYFQFGKASDERRKAARFLVGLTPALLQRSHIVDFDYVDFSTRKVPSLNASCLGAAAIASTEALKIVLGRGKLRPLPWTHQFDMLNLRYKKNWSPFGLRSPLNRLKLWYLSSKVMKGA